MIIIVKQIGPAPMRSARSPRSAAGSSPRRCDTGRVMAMQGGFDVIGSSYNRATQANRQPGSAFKPIVYVTALENGMTPASIIVDAPFCVWQGAGLGNKCFRNFDGEYSGPKTMRWGVEQSRNLMTIRAASQTGMEKVVRTRPSSASAITTVPVDRAGRRRHDRAQADQCLCDPGQQRPRAVKPTLIDYVQDRNGKVIYRSDNRCQVMEQDNGGACNADWDGKAMPRPPSPGSRCSIRRPPTRWFTSWKAWSSAAPRPCCATSTGRCSARPARPAARPTSGSSAARPTSSPASISATTSRGRWAACAKAAASPRRSSSSSPRSPSRTCRRFRSSRRRDPHGPDRPRTGKRVFGTFPTTVDPKSSVIWEAFQPETEPRRRSAEASTCAAPPRGGNGAPRRRAATAPRRPSPGRRRQRRILAKAGRHLLGGPQALYESHRRCAPKRKPISTRSTPPPPAAPLPRLGQGAARLDELNAKVEDPTLWDDPKAAQEVMRERRRLEEAIGATQKIEHRAQGHGRADRDGRGRRATRRWSTTASGARRACRARRARQGRGAARRRGRRQQQPMSRSMPAPAAPRARTGPRCCSACTPAGPSGTATRSSWSSTIPASRPGIKSATC